MESALLAPPFTSRLARKVTHEIARPAAFISVNFQGQRVSGFKCGLKGQKLPKTEHVDMTSVQEDTNESEGHKSPARGAGIGFCGKR